MSAGSWGYAWCQLQELADRLCEEQPARRKALGAQLRAVSNLMYEIERHDSCNKGSEDLEKAWAVYGAAVPGFQGEGLKQAVQSAESTLDELRSAIEQAKEGTP